MNERVGVILREVRMHEKYFERFGTKVSENEREEMGTVAYTRYVLDVAQSKSMLHLQVATLPCAIGYAEVGRRLMADPDTKRGDDNPYVDNATVFWHLPGMLTCVCQVLDMD